jgi:chromosome segregation ATPase
MIKDGNKAVVISLILACFILLYATVAFYTMEESEKGKKKALQKRFDEVITVKQDLETKLKDADTLNIELKTRLTTQEETIAKITGQLEEEQKSNNDNVASLRVREDELRSLKTQLETEKAAKADLQKKCDQANAEYLNLKARVEDSLKAKENMDTKAKEQTEREGVSLGTIKMGS